MTTTTRALHPHRAAVRYRVGPAISRYGLALVLIWIGAMKFFSFEAEGIQPLIANSPLTSWLYNLLSVGALSAALGVVEIALGTLIALPRFAPRLSGLASLGACVLFLTTLSFMVTTPGAWEPGYGFPFLGSTGGFLLKDLVLLGAAVTTANEALATAGRNPRWF
ncbi:YkgB family protein [Nocardia sp. NPDC051570]|uniref:YkgB family protein n=1 Tax=Nocardia sp. NPDC051570 TaxID=3364324 RepID=UPI0037B41CD8